MEQTTLPAQFSLTISNWIESAHKLTATRLAYRPADGGWSLGQVYGHLIAVTHRMFNIVENLCTHNKNQHEQKTEKGKTAFLDNELPDERIRSVSSSAPDELTDPAIIETALKDIDEKFHHYFLIASRTPFEGKMVHPVLGYLNAMEWLQFTEMHFRHHYRQRERIEAELPAVQ